MTTFTALRVRDFFRSLGLTRLRLPVNDRVLVVTVPTVGTWHVRYITHPKNSGQWTIDPVEYQS